MGPQKRRFPRYECQEEVTIGIMRGQIPEYVYGRCTDLGEGGAGVRTRQALNVGEIVDFEIPLSIGPLRVPACICYQNGPNYGCEFLGLGIPERQYIRRACRSLARIG